MSACRAFGDEAKKQALIADIHAKGPIYSAWLTDASASGDISSISEDYGLHPALVRLLPGLGTFGEFDDALPFYEALLDAIPVGADTGGLARQALLLAWTDPVYGRSKVVERGEVFEACEDIVALVRKSIASPVDKKVWRAVRSKLVNAHAEKKGPEMAVDLILSLAWDLDQSPGAAADVMRAWTSSIDVEADAADEDRFSDAEDAAFKAAMERINEEAVAIISDQESDDDVNYEAFLAEVARRWAADPVTHALQTRSLARRDRTRAKLAQWRAAIQRKVLELAEARTGMI